jgi:hypothetical protein
VPKGAEAEQQAALQITITRMRRQLETIYGPERIWSWLEENTPLPAASVTTAQSVVFEARVEDVGTKRSKEGSRTRVVLIAKRRGTPVDDLCELSDQDTMLVTISPRIVQQSLLDYAANQAYSETSEVGANFELAPFEPNISDDTLRVRLLSLGKPELPDGWQQWPQEKKDQVAHWAWSMMLKASDNEDIVIPEVAADVQHWYWPSSQNGTSTNGATEIQWTADPPPHSTPEQMEQVAKHSAGTAAKPKGKPKKNDEPV